MSFASDISSATSTVTGALKTVAGAVGAVAAGAAAVKTVETLFGGGSPASTAPASVPAGGSTAIAKKAVALHPVASTPGAALSTSASPSAGVPLTGPAATVGGSLLSYAARAAGRSLARRFLPPVPTVGGTAGYFTNEKPFGFPRGAWPGESFNSIMVRDSFVPGAWFRHIQPGLLEPAGPIRKGSIVPIIDASNSVNGDVFCDIAIPARSIVVFGASGSSPLQFPGGRIMGQVRVNDETGTNYVGYGTVIAPRKRRRKYGLERAIRDSARDIRKLKSAKKKIDKVLPSPRHYSRK